MSAELYIVLADGRWVEQAMLGMGAALDSALRHVDGMQVSEVVIADARTYAVHALWSRTGCTWTLHASEGWGEPQVSGLSPTGLSR